MVEKEDARPSLSEPRASGELGKSTAPATFGAFLIADVRGYSTFTRERGNAASAMLAKLFADLARDAVEARSGPSHRAPRR